MEVGKNKLLNEVLFIRGDRKRITLRLNGNQRTFWLERELDWKSDWMQCCNDGKVRFTYKISIPTQEIELKALVILQPITNESRIKGECFILIDRSCNERLRQVEDHNRVINIDDIEIPFLTFFQQAKIDAVRSRNL